MILAPPRREVLVVDDEPAITALLGRILTADGLTVRTACDGHEALARIAERKPDLVVLDVDMPRLNGYAVCYSLRDDPATRLLPVLILTGRDPDAARLKAWELGADGFLCKPFKGREVAARCRSLLRHKELVDALDSPETSAFAVARMVEAKSPYTHGHSERVTAHALALGNAVGLGRDELDTLRRGARLHDVGKVATPDAVLNKPGRLTAEEYELIKRHPLEGVKIVEPLRTQRDTLPLIRWHHERPDGRGYPDGLSGESIPPLVRILSVADVFDSLTSTRPYRAAMTAARGLDVLDDEAAGGGLDPELVRTFRELTPEAADQVSEMA